jgi:hypothetical protein
MESPATGAIAGHAATTCVLILNAIRKCKLLLVLFDFNEIKHLKQIWFVFVNP